MALVGEDGAPLLTAEDEELIKEASIIPFFRMFNAPPVTTSAFMKTDGSERIQADGARTFCKKGETRDEAYLR